MYIKKKSIYLFTYKLFVLQYDIRNMCNIHYITVYTYSNLRFIYLLLEELYRPVFLNLGVTIILTKGHVG